MSAVPGMMLKIKITGDDGVSESVEKHVNVRRQKGEFGSIVDGHKSEFGMFGNSERSIDMNGVFDI